jgi:antitoxin (DNA-binding transcriptional repressor) of toxin-antitoxin stability system
LCRQILRRLRLTAYSVADAKKRLSSLIDKALAGEQVIITRRGRPVVELKFVQCRHTASA